MKSHEARTIAGQFLTALAGGLKGMAISEMVETWLQANNIEYPIVRDPSGEERDDAAEAEYEIIKAVTQAIEDAGRRTSYRAQQDQAARVNHEMRVEAIVEQFGLEASDDEGYRKVDVQTLTDALFGADL